MSVPEAIWLHPWLPVVRDAAGALRVGTRPLLPQPDPAHADAVNAAVRALTDPGGPTPPAAGLRLLDRWGLLVDGAAVASVARHGGEAAVRAYLSRHSRQPAAAARVGNRGRVVIQLAGADAVTDQVRDTIRRCGLETVTRAHQAHRERRVIVVHVGRPSPRVLQEWMSSGVVHLVITPRPAGMRVGPLVVPGATACLQCLHLARTDRDPQWPGLSEQLRRRNLPQPDPVIVAQAAALACRGLVQHVETGHSELHGAYWQVDIDEPTTSVPVARHPLCGCWWPTAPEASTATAEDQLVGQAPAEPPVV